MADQRPLRTINREFSPVKSTSEKARQPQAGSRSTETRQTKNPTGPRQGRHVVRRIWPTVDMSDIKVNQLTNANRLYGQYDINKHHKKTRSLRRTWRIYQHDDRFQTLWRHHTSETSRREGRRTNSTPQNPSSPPGPLVQQLPRRESSTPLHLIHIQQYNITNIWGYTYEDIHFINVVCQLCPKTTMLYSYTITYYDVLL